jgi:hypothetical protein
MEQPEKYFSNGKKPFELFHVKLFIKVKSVSLSNHYII